jgi:hypothetical protein
VQRDPDDSNVFLIFRGMAVAPDWPAQLAAAQRETAVCIAGCVLPRIRYGDEGRAWGPADVPCHDCAAIKGEFHVPGCDVERCPACRGQAISCGCAEEQTQPSG